MYRAWREPALREALGSAGAGICDGIGVSLAAGILQGRWLRRITGCDLFTRIIPLAAQRGWGVFLLGASAQANQKAAENLRRQYPSLRIVGRRDGFFEDDAEVVREINQTRPDLLFVAMGSPRQEFWIARHMASIDARFFMGVGGTFDVVGGLARRAPRLLRAVGLEFLYQLVTQPKRWQRQIIYVPFLLRVLGRRLSGRRIEELPRLKIPRAKRLADPQEPNVSR
jgi:N-acetylglucosaminyldiphosphoundecaprenol N-acetyl-beta-D-mannosaminyltransferase